MTQVGSMEYNFRSSGAQTVIADFDKITKAQRQAAQETLRVNKQNAALMKAEERAQAQAAKQAQQTYKSWASSSAELSKQMQAQELASQKASEAATQKITTGFKNIGIAAVAMGYTVKKGYEFLKSGAELQYTTQKFDRLSTSAGAVSKVFMNDLRVATKGTMNDMQLMDQAGQLLQLGLANNADEAVILSRNMTALGQDMGEVTLAIANQSKRRLDQLGLSLVRFNEIEAELAAKNPMMDKQELFKQAFIQTSNETIAITGNMADSALGNFQRFEAGWANLWNTVKQEAPNWQIGGKIGTMFGNQSISNIAGQVGNTANAIAMLMSGDYKVGGNFGWNSQTNQLEFDIVQKTLMDYATYNARQQGMKKGGSILSGGAGITATGQGRSLVSNQAALMAQYYQQGGQYAGMTATPQQAAINAGETLVNYEAILPGAMALSDNQMKVADATAQINAELNRQRAILADLNSQGYDSTNSKVMEVKQNIIDLTAQSQQAAQSQIDMTNQVMMANIAAASSDEDKAKNQLDYARATGQITEEAYQQQSALMAVSQAFADGKLNAEQAAQMAELVMTKLEALNGMTVDAFINLVVNDKGGAALGFGSGVGGQTLMSSTGTTGSNGPAITMQAGGGPLNIGGWTMVGEQGFELISPSGHVYNNAQSQRMLQGGLHPSRGFAAGGSILLDGLMNITPSNAIEYGAPTTYNKPKSGSTVKSASDPIVSTIAASISEPIAQIMAMEIGRQSFQTAMSFERMNTTQKSIASKLDTLIATVSTNNGVARALFTERSRLG